MRGKANQGTEEIKKLGPTDGAGQMESKLHSLPPEVLQKHFHPHVRAEVTAPALSTQQKANKPASPPSRTRAAKGSRRSGPPSTPEVVVQSGKRLCLLPRPPALNEYSVKEDGGILKMTQTLKCLEAVRRKFCATFGRHLC